MFGGNSNWQGPIWMPVNALIIRALLTYYLYYGDSFNIECPTGSGTLMNFFDVSKDITNRLTGIFLRDEQGRRPRVWWDREVPERPALAGSHSFLQVFPWRQWGGTGRKPPNRLDETGSQAYRAFCPT